MPYPPLFYDSRRVIMSATLGLVHAKHIEELKRSISTFATASNVKSSWDVSAPYKDGSFYVWEHTFKSGVLKHSIIFQEDINSGQLLVLVGGVDIGVRVGNMSGFSSMDYENILSYLNL